jgi:3-oxoacyl-[acyl-carrier protein] reductase
MLFRSQINYRQIITPLLFQSYFHEYAVAYSDQKLIAGTPLGRFGEPEDNAPLAVFLASDDAHWITGESIRASGGVRGVGY